MARLVLVVGTALAVGVLPRLGGSVLALAAVLVPAGVLAAGNVIAGADDGISTAGMLLGALSVAQLGLMVTGLVLRPEGAGRQHAEPGVAPPAARRR